MINLFRSEWIKVRTVRVNFVLGLIAAAFPVVVIALIAALSSDERGTARDLVGAVTGTMVLTSLLLGVIGALNLFTDQQVTFDQDALAVAQAMADVATIGLLHERNLHEKTILSEQLQTALHSRVLIEQAKGMLAARANVGVSEAFNRMRAHARRDGLTLTAVAQAVVDGTIDVNVLASP